jgi:hypothetical protein
VVQASFYLYSLAMADPIESLDINVAGDAGRARETVASALEARGFKVVWTDAWNGTATKGSKTKQAILGALATYFEVWINVFAADGSAVIHLSRPSTGISGGLAGRARAKKQFASLGAELSGVFQANGVLLPPPAQ